MDISITESTAIAITEWTAGIMLSGLVLLFLWGCCCAAYDEFRQRKRLENAYKRETLNMSSPFEHTVDAMTKCMEEFQCVYDFDLNAIKSNCEYNAAVRFIELCTEVTLRTYKEDKYVAQDPQVKKP